METMYTRVKEPLRAIGALVFAILLALTMVIATPSEKAYASTDAYIDDVTNTFKIFTSTSGAGYTSPRYAITYKSLTFRNSYALTGYTVLGTQSVLYTPGGSNITYPGIATQYKCIYDTW
jgi:hypothetical protein